MPKTAYNWHAVLLTAYRLHAVLMTAYSWHAVLMAAFDSILHACSSIKSIQSTQSEQLTRTSQCLFWRLPLYNYTNYNFHGVILNAVYVCFEPPVHPLPPGTSPSLTTHTVSHCCRWCRHLKVTTVIIIFKRSICLWCVVIYLYLAQILIWAI